MLPFLAAALMQPAAATPAPPVDPDLRCMAAFLFAVGQMGEEPESTEADKAAATSIVMYYFGKVRVRMPGADIKPPINRLVEQPGYLENELKGDLERCGKEFETRGKELEAFGAE